MAHNRTIVEVHQFVYNEQGEQLDIEGKVIGGIKTTKIQKPMLTKERYYLLHWGLETTVYHGENNYPVPVSHTVGICQHLKTGIIQTFIPGVIKVIGVER